MKIRLLLIIATLALPALACQTLTGGEAPAENVLFQDDFSDPKSGWESLTQEDRVTDYTDGAYRILVNEINVDAWANPGLNFQDVSIEVDATKIAGDDNNDFGVICRYQDASNFYFFVLSSDGYYGIAKRVEGKPELIAQDQMLSSDEVLQGGATNRVRADCVGSTLSLYANGELLVEVQDDTFTTGDVGLIAGTFDRPGTEIRFDNFLVNKP